jgi:hypothetical protein
MLEDPLQHFPPLLFIPSVVVCAPLFDQGSGFFATPLSAAIAAYLFIEPKFSLGMRANVKIVSSTSARIANCKLQPHLNMILFKVSYKTRPNDIIGPAVSAEKIIFLQLNGSRSDNMLSILSIR